MAAKRKKDQFATPILFFVDCEHYSVRVAKFTISVNCIENTSKALRKSVEVVREPRVSHPLLLIWCHHKVV
jgi:hypothetical protein